MNFIGVETAQFDGHFLTAPSFIMITGGSNSGLTFDLLSFFTALILEILRFAFVIFAGKTYLTANLLKNLDYSMPGVSIGKFILIYDIAQPIYQDMIAAMPSDAEIVTMPHWNEQLLEDETTFTLPDPEKYTVLLVDDQQRAALRSPAFERLARTVIHHKSKNQ